MLIQNIGNNTFTVPSNTQRVQSKASVRLKPQLTCDTVSFGSRDLLLSSKDEITTKVKTALADTHNYLGAGADAEVYRIPDTDYCVRVLYIDDEYNSGIPELLKRKNLGLSFNISEQDKVNHVVAKFSKGTIMKFIEGVPVWTPFMSESEINENAKIIQDAPVSTFHKLLRQISHAYENNMMFDCNYGNIIVNPKDKSITAIDFYDMKGDIEVSHPLSHIYTGVTYAKFSTEQRKNLANKILRASLQEMKPEHKPCLDVRNLDFYKFIYRLHNDNIIDSNKFTELLVNTFSEIEELKLKELNGEDVINLLNHKIKIAKTLIKQVL